MDAKLIDGLMVPTIRVSDIATLKSGWEEAGVACANMRAKIAEFENQSFKTYASAFVTWAARGAFISDSVMACYAQLDYTAAWAYLPIRLTEGRFNPRIRNEWNNKAFFAPTSPYSGVWETIEAYRVWADDTDEVIGLLINLGKLTKTFGKSVAMHLCISWRYCWELWYGTANLRHMGKTASFTIEDMLDAGMPMNRVFVAHQFLNYGPGSHLNAHFIAFTGVSSAYIENILVGKPVSKVGAHSSYYAYGTDSPGYGKFMQDYGLTQAAINKLIIDNNVQGYVDLVTNVFDKAEAEGRKRHNLEAQPAAEPRVYRRKKKVADVIAN